MSDPNLLTLREPASGSRHRAPLFLIVAPGVNALGHVAMTRPLPLDQPVYLVQPRSAAGASPPRDRARRARRVSPRRRGVPRFDPDRAAEGALLPERYVRRRAHRFRDGAAARGLRGARGRARDPRHVPSGEHLVSPARGDGSARSGLPLRAPREPSERLRKKAVEVVARGRRSWARSRPQIRRGGGRSGRRSGGRSSGLRAASSSRSSRLRSPCSAWRSSLTGASATTRSAGAAAPGVS